MPKIVAPRWRACHVGPPGEDVAGGPSETPCDSSPILLRVDSGSSRLAIDRFRYEDALRPGCVDDVQEDLFWDFDSATAFRYRSAHSPERSPEGKGRVCQKRGSGTTASAVSPARSRGLLRALLGW